LAQRDKHLQLEDTIPVRYVVDDITSKIVTHGFKEGVNSVIAVV
jgi:hypothetical protein